MANRPPTLNTSHYGVLLLFEMLSGVWGWETGSSYSVLYLNIIWLKLKLCSLWSDYFGVV